MQDSSTETNDVSDEQIERACVICKTTINILDNNTKKNYVVLTKKGVSGILNSSKERGDNILAHENSIVHIECRAKYTNKRRIETAKRKLDDVKSDKIAKVIKLRSSTSFDYKTNCIFCTVGIGERELSKKEAYQVMSKNKNFDLSIKTACSERNDQWADEVRGRLEFVNDLHAMDTKYHAICDTAFRTHRQIPKKYSTCEEKQTKAGRPKSSIRENAFVKVLEYLKQNEDLQLTLNDLMVLMTKELDGTGEEPYSVTYIKSKLEEMLKNDVSIVNVNGKLNVITLRTTASKIVSAFFSEKNFSDVNDAQNKILLAAAKLIKNDIKSMNVDSSHYPSSDDLSEEQNLKYLPTSLRSFLENMIVNTSSKLKISSIGQSIVQMVRPRLLMAPLQISLAIQMHRRYGSRFIVDTLHNLGFCSSYADVQHYIRSAALNQGSEVNGVMETDETLMQYVADNVDHNLCTLDGSNTFHGMGIIATITPKTNKINRVPKSLVSSKDIVDIANIEIKTFAQKRSPFKLRFNKLPCLLYDQIDSTNLLWRCTWLLKPGNSLWNGFMETVYNNGEYPGQSSVVLLPMIDMNASDKICIYSTLHYVTTQAKKYNQTPILTFDQPLFQKALDIITNEEVDSPLKSIILRLGGLHTCMSFLGAIGHLMSSSGLQQALETIYAVDTVPHMLNGKAISRAIRGHLILSGVLSAVIMSEIFECPVVVEDIENSDFKYELFESNDIPHLSAILDLNESLTNKEILPEEYLDDEFMVELMRKLCQYRKEHDNFRTAKLWFQYIDMVGILCSFIKAERMGNFDLHLKSLSMMLPFLASSGHHLYTKSVYLYLQQMNELESTHPSVLNKFKRGFHVVRRTDKFWGGLSTDLVIEQVLMRSLKSNGGMTRGRGMSEEQRAMWILSTPSCVQICEAMQELTNVNIRGSEQHQELSRSRLHRDYKDAMHVLQYILPRNPFVPLYDLINIHSGEVASADVNVEECGVIGSKIVESMVSKNVESYVFKKKERAVTMKSSSSIQLETEVVNVDPQLLFQRIISSFQGIGSDVDLKTAFSYELTTYPSSLGEKDGMLRPADKSQLANSIWKISGELDISIPINPSYVIDGGSLLHRIPWTKGNPFSEICNKYVIHLKHHYGKDIIVVFDGYGAEPSTKDVTHLRRTNGKTGRIVLFTDDTPLCMRKEDFLMNHTNKANFLRLLIETLETNEIPTIQSKDDADIDIALTSIQSSKGKPTVLIGEDTDLLILLLHYSNAIDRNHHSLFFKSEQFKKANKVWSIKHTVEKLGPSICNAILPIHALLGCDTTSRIYSIGKSTGLLKARKDSNFLQNMLTFTKKDLSQYEIGDAGEQSLVKLYGSKDITLNELRLIKFNQKVATSRKQVQPEMLCPTSDAAHFHSLRTYHQVQSWLGNDLNPLEWGWKLVQGRLMPMFSSQPPAPPSLLKLIRCGCKTGCTSRSCTCVKYSLHCSAICGECKGSCENGYKLPLETDSESED